MDRRQEENLAVHGQPGDGSYRHHDAAGLLLKCLELQRRVH
jgi:hypothetical protein